MIIKGIARYIVDSLVERTNELSQGRNAGALGFVNDDGYIDKMTDVVDGGLSGIPLRVLLSKITSMENKSLVEGLDRLPPNTVFISTRPGKTGFITDVSGVDFFNCPIVGIGVKGQGVAGVGLIYPKPEYFDLATESERLNIATLGTRNMAEEKAVLRKTNKLALKYLELTEELPVVDLEERPRVIPNDKEQGWKLPAFEVNEIDKAMADELVNTSMQIGQGREVAMLGVVENNGAVMPKGKIVEGGMGYVPSRLLASSAVDISGKSLRQIYRWMIPSNAVIVHTHPGGTGVMHIGDANAGPGTWGRPIIAIGHDKHGKVRGATVVESTPRLFQLADEDESLNLAFFQADTPEEETNIRNRKFGIAQEYTNLCKPIEIK